jgi:hypothetical protein
MAFYFINRMQSESILILFVAVIKVTSRTKYNSLINNKKYDLVPNWFPYNHVNRKQWHTSTYVLTEYSDILI